MQSTETVFRTVLLVDDHPFMRHAYRTVLERAADLNVVGEADTGEHAVRAFSALAPAVVVMDLRMPGIGGLEAIRRIREREPRARILACSVQEDAFYVGQALQAGAQGYLNKGSPPSLLLDALRALLAGERFVDPATALRIERQANRGVRSPVAALSIREFEIFLLLASGETVKEIAQRLSLSGKTIANYTTDIKTKLQLKSVAEMARLAIRCNLLEP